MEEVDLFDYLRQYQEATDMDDETMLRAVCELLQRAGLSEAVVESFPLSDE